MARMPVERKIDEGVEESFPASDPPAHATTPKGDRTVKKPRDGEGPTSFEGEDQERAGKPGATTTSQGG